MMKSLSKPLRLAGAMILLTNLLHNVVGAQDEGHYGVDVSWPMHHGWTESSKPLSEERRAVYEDYMNGCREKYKAKGTRCDDNEQQRLEMTLRQPQSMRVSKTYRLCTDTFSLESLVLFSQSLTVSLEFHLYRLYEDPCT
jgi:hypothetical protein